MSAFKANAMWLKPERLALGTSAVVTFGGLGFLAGTYPANLAADLIGWRALFGVLVVFTLVVTATIYFLVPKRDDDHHPVAFSQQVRGYVDIFRDGIFWRVTPMVAAISGTFIADADAVGDALDGRCCWAGTARCWAAIDDPGPVLRDRLALDRLHRRCRPAPWHRAEIHCGRGLRALRGRTARDDLSPCPSPNPSLCRSSGSFMASPAKRPIWAMRRLAHISADALAGRAQSAANLILFLASALFQSSIGWALDHLSQPSRHRRCRLRHRLGRLAGAAGSGFRLVCARPLRAGSASRLRRAEVGVSQSAGLMRRRQRRI